jgi:hypothetical protein
MNNASKLNMFVGVSHDIFGHEVLTFRKRLLCLEEMEPIRTGVGDCCSSLIQGINFYRKTGCRGQIGLMHREIGGYRPHDIEIDAAFDIDERKWAGTSPGSIREE